MQRARGQLLAGPLYDVLFFPRAVILLQLLLVLVEVARAPELKGRVVANREPVADRALRAIRSCLVAAVSTAGSVRPGADATESGWPVSHNRSTANSAGWKLS